jgi:hypothetical protein
MDHPHEADADDADADVFHRSFRINHLCGLIIDIPFAELSGSDDFQAFFAPDSVRFLAAILPQRTVWGKVKPPLENPAGRASLALERSAGMTDFLPLVRRGGNERVDLARDTAQ